jgi:flagellar hook protein FlgE
LWAPGVTSAIQDGVAIEKEMSNVDLTEEIPEMIPTQRGYEANLKAIKTQDEMLGTLINLKT